MDVVFVFGTYCFGNPLFVDPSYSHLLAVSLQWDAVDFRTSMDVEVSSPAPSMERPIGPHPTSLPLGPYRLWISFVSAEIRLPIRSRFPEAIIYIREAGLQIDLAMDVFASLSRAYRHF